MCVDPCPVGSTTVPKSRGPKKETYQGPVNAAIEIHRQPTWDHIDARGQARNHRGAIGQLPLPKFSQTYVFVRRSNKLHHIASPRKYQLVAILTVATLCMGPIVASYVGALKQDMWALDWTHSGVLAGIVTWQRSVSFCLRQMWLRIYQ